MIRCPHCQEEFEEKQIREYILKNNEIDNLDKSLFCPNCKKPFLDV